MNIQAEVDFMGRFPENGFYVTINDFRTENLVFIAGDVVALKKYGNQNVRINRTGPGSSYANYMLAYQMRNLRKLTSKEIAFLTNGVNIPAGAFVNSESIETSMTALVEACKLITHPRGFGVKIKILHVEKDPAWQQRIKDLFRDDTYEVVTIASLEEAKAVFVSGYFPLVICDKTLQYKDDGYNWGLQLYENGFKVIVTSMDLLSDTVINIYKPGFDPGHFLFAIRELLKA